MSKLRKRSELARYLGTPPEEIDRMIEEDGLPCLRLPGARKPAIRFRLRDVHRWLQKWNKGCDLKNYAEFVLEFEEAQPGDTAVESGETSKRE